MRFKKKINWLENSLLLKKLPQFVIQYKQLNVITFEQIYSYNNNLIITIRK
jgi:hypothetical protein